MNVNVDGALLGSTIPEVAETIRAALLRIGNRNGSIFGGLA